MKGFSTKLELRIDWLDVDVLGHVNNVAILKYIQAARVNYLEAVYFMRHQSKSEIGPILASTSCQFRKPLFYPGQVTVYSKVSNIKNTSFRIEHEIYNDKNELAAKAQDIIVIFDFIKNTKLLIPKELREKIEGLENRKQGDN